MDTIYIVQSRDGAQYVSAFDTAESFMAHYESLVADGAVSYPREHYAAAVRAAATQPHTPQDIGEGDSVIAVSLGTRNGGSAVTGEATVYYAMPTGPDEPSAASVAEWAESVKEAASACAKLEEAGWKPRWCDNPGDNEFVEIAYEKQFVSEDEAVAEVKALRIGVDPIWDEF